MLARKKAMKLMPASAAMPGPDAELTVTRMMNVLEDMDRSMPFMTRRPHGSVLELNPGERLDRWGMNVRISERAHREADFRRDLRANPTGFFCQTCPKLFGARSEDEFGIDEVRLAGDTNTTLYLVLAAMAARPPKLSAIVQQRAHAPSVGHDVHGR